MCHLLILWLQTSRSIASTVTTSNCNSYCKLDQDCTSELIYYVNTRTYTTTEDRNPANNRINQPLSTVITWPGYAATNVKRAIRLMLRLYSSCYKRQNTIAIKTFFYLLPPEKNGNSSVSTVTRPSVRRPKNRGSGEEILLLSETSRVNRGAHPASYSMYTMGASSKEADLPPPSTRAGVKNARSHTITPHRTI